MAVSKSLRFQVLRRDNHTCRYCGRSAPEVRITVDHVVPSALGGCDTADNLVAACHDCNSGKSATPPDAAQVEQVREDALRWSAAVRAVAEEMVADSQKRTALSQRFLQAWQVWKIDGQALPLPPAWRESVDNFVAAGLPMPVLIDCIELAMGRTRVENDDKFRYMCGIAWKRVTELQQAALQRVARPTAQAAAQQGNGDEIVSHLFGQLPWCDRPDVWSALVYEFDQAHEDDEDNDGRPVSYEHWSDFEKVFAFSVAHIAEQREALSARIRQALDRLSPQARQRYLAESESSHQKAGPPEGTPDEIAAYAVALAMQDHTEAGPA